MPGSVGAAAAREAVDVVELKRKRAVLVAGARSPNTVRAYEADWRHFEAWCKRVGRRGLPASGETVELYLTALVGGCKVSTLNRRMAGIRDKYRRAGLADPVGPGARDVIAGAARKYGSRAEGKAAVSVQQLRAMLGKLGCGVRDARDRALLLFGFASGLRRSELVGLDLADLVFVKGGVRIHVGRSKTDQVGQGRELGVFAGERPRTCPVLALRGWLKVRPRGEGPVFYRVWRGVVGRERLDGKAVCDVVKRCAKAAGLDGGKYGAHSLRAGMITAAVEAGAPESLVAQRSGHKSLAMLARYVRPASVFRIDPLKGVL